MKHSFPSWLLLIVLMSGAVGATYVACPGCVDRHRGNKACEWTGDSTFPINSANPAHRRHLISDAQLAEELAVRYADAEYGRLFGVEAHGGLLDHGRVRNECMARLVSAIENNHAVTPDQVAIARAARNPIFDFLVVLLFLPLYGCVATKACGLLRNLVLADARYIRLVALIVASVSVSFLGLLLFRLWWGVMEAIRVGNGHMSTFRAATHNYWGHQYVGALFVGGLLVFWLVAAFSYRVTSSNGHVSTDTLSQGILLR